MVDLGVVKELTPEEASINNIKRSIRIIEGMFQAMNQQGVVFPLRVSEVMLEGMSFLNQMHTQLLEQLPPEVVAEMRNQNKPKPVAPPPPALVKPDGTTPAA